jgi:hypothetical protein
MKWIQTMCGCSCSLFVVADIMSALLLRSIGKVLERTHSEHFLLLGLVDPFRVDHGKKGKRKLPLLFLVSGICFWCEFVGAEVLA